VGDVLGYQLLKAGTSIGANYREANRAESKNDFIHKIGIVEKEAAETQYWLELCNHAEVGDKVECQLLLEESGQLLATRRGLYPRWSEGGRRFSHVAAGVGGRYGW
jgi:four helix bundle protein